MNAKRDPRNTKQWMIDTTIKMPDGKRAHLHRSGFDTKGHAEVAYFKIYSDFCTSHGFKSIKGTFNNLAADFLSHKSEIVKKSSLRGDELAIRAHIVSSFDGMPINVAFTTTYLQEFRNKVIKLNVQERWKNNILSLLQEMAEFSFNRKIINPEMYRLTKLYTERLRGEGKPKTFYTIWTKDQYKTFIDTFDYNDDFKILFQWFFFSGCRVGELLALQWKDFSEIDRKILINKTVSAHFGTGKAEITSTKTESGVRFVVLSDAMTSLFLELRNKQHPDDESFIFFGQDYALSSNTLKRKFDKHTIIAGLPHISLREIRHTNNTWLLNDHQSREEADLITKRLGRSSLKVTLDTYYHSNPVGEKVIADRIDISGGRYPNDTQLIPKKNKNPI